MIKSLTKFFTAIVQKYLPDPLVFAMILTLIMFASGIVFTGHTPVEMMGFWGKNFWNLLAFAMQMALILVTGTALASSPPVKRILQKIASIPKTPVQGIVLVTFAAAVTNIINWGFGLVVGALLAKEVAKKVPHTDYRLLIASAYIGFMTWHGGISGSVPLLAATKGNPMEKTIGLIELGDTIFTPFNIFITGTLIILLPLLTRMMMPKDQDVVEIDPALLVEDGVVVNTTGSSGKKTFAEHVENSKILALLIGIFGFAYVVYYFSNEGKLDVNAVNMMMFFAGLILHGSPLSYMQAVVNGAKGTAGIMIQFPFYAGIQGMMDHSGLGGMITQGFINISTKETFSVLAFLSSGMINFFVPSGGGHWVVQGPFIMPAAQALGVDLGKAAMAIAYGEAWMNMAQPFWALPALAIAGLKVRDIMGFCVTALIASSVVFLIGLSFF